MTYFYYSFLFAFLYVYSGLGLTLLFCPTEFRRYALFLSPPVGYCYLTLLGWYLYCLDLGGTDVYAPALLVPPLVFLYFAFKNRKGQDTPQHRLLDVELVTALGVGIGAFIIVSIPSFVYPEGLTTISLGNNDLPNYANVARYLKEFSASDTVGFLGQTDKIKLLASDTVFGAFLATAVPSSLFSLDTYQLQNISLHVFFLFSILLFYTVAREIFRYSHISALGITALFGLSPILYYSIYQGFEAQIIAMGLMLCLLLLHVQAIDKCERISNYYSYVPLVVLFNWGISITYSHMLPLVYLPIIGYLIVVAFYNKSRSQITNWALFFATTMAITFLLSPMRSKSLVSYFLFAAAIQAGWHMPWMSPDTVFGLLTEAFLQPHRNSLRLLLSIPIVVVVILGFVKAYQQDRRLFILAASTVGLIILGYNVLAFPGQPGALWGSYKSYKFLSFFLPLVLLGSLLLFRDLQLNSKSRLKYLLLGSLVMLVGCNVVASRNQVTMMSKLHKALKKDTVDLAKLDGDNRVQSVNIRGTDWWDIMWQANFLMRKKIYFETSTYSPYQASSLDGEWDLRPFTEPVDDILHIDGFGKPERIPINSSYVLENAKPTSLKARLGIGWYSSEKSHRWTGNGSDVSSIIFDSVTDKLAIDFQAKYWPLNPNNHISIYLNGNRIVDCVDNSSCQVNGMVLSNGQNILEFKTAMPPVLPGTRDPRRLAYAFNSIDVSPARAISDRKVVPIKLPGKTKRPSLQTKSRRAA